MDANEFLNKGIGTKEKSTLKPAVVKIAGIDFQVETKDGKKMDSPLARITVKHPESEDTIVITKVKFEKNGKLIVVGIWCNLDEDGNFQKGSSVSAIMKHLGVEKLADAIGKEIATVEQSETDHYLCLKAY